MRLYTLCSVFVDNGLDVDISIQIKGNRFTSRTKSVNMGSSFTVSSGSVESRTLTPDTSGWLPYIYAEVEASSTPSSGKVNIYVIRRG